ncbi:hypothetical protein ACR2SE_09590 [Citrobacter freundii]|uniref:hypothetical protein n=1 Tax=Citrobacter freundii TaxID=546 RepID=UPI003DA0F663
MKKIIALIFMFFYIYPILFIGLPFTTRIILSLIGFMMFCYTLAYKKVFFFKRYFFMLIILFSIFFLSCTTVLINGTTDLEFIKYPFSFCAILFGAYGLFNIMRTVKINLDFCSVVELIIGVVFLQSVIAVIMYVIPEFYNFLLSLQNISPSEFEKMSSLSDMRVIGFGSQYFGAGITNGFALIMLAYLIRLGYYKNSLIKASIVYVIIFSVGIAMARTTFIGLALSLLLLLPFESLRKINVTLLRRNVRFYFAIFVFLILSSGFVFAFFPSIISKIEPLVNFALEMFLNYINSGQFTTESTSQLG